MRERDKEAVALAAVSEARAGMLVGLGTGATAAFAIRALAARVQDGLKVEAVATSEASAALARGLGIVVRDFADVAQVDLTIDGADEIDERLYAIKGAGGAMVREKIVAAASTRMVVIADGSKRVERIGRAALPVEVLPFARAFVIRELEATGATAVLRGGDDPCRTDGGNLVLDCRFEAMPDPIGLAAAIDAMPGVVGHGLFLREVDAVYLADGGVVTRLERAAAVR